MSFKRNNSFPAKADLCAAPLPFFMQIQKMQFHEKRKNCNFARTENSKRWIPFSIKQPLLII